MLTTTYFRILKFRSLTGAKIESGKTKSINNLQPFNIVTVDSTLEVILVYMFYL